MVDNVRDLKQILGIFPSGPDLEPLDAGMEHRLLLLHLEYRRHMRGLNRYLKTHMVAVTCVFHCVSDLNPDSNSENVNRSRCLQK